MRKKVIFINFPVSGHINPQYELCKELAKQDIDFIYYTAERYLDKYKSIDNLEVKLYPKEFMDYYDMLSDNIEYHKKIMAIMYVFNTLTEKILPYMQQEIDKENPDLIICDSLALWGKIIARHNKIPYMLFFTSFMGDSKTIKSTPGFRKQLLKAAITDFKFIYKFLNIQKRIEKIYGKNSENITKVMDHQGKFTVVATSREFHPGGKCLPANIKFIKPYMYRETRVNKDKDTIFVSMGTISFSKSFWDKCIEATVGLGYRVVISFGGNKKNKVNIKDIPDNVEIYENLPLDAFREELERSEIIITHGGFNSITDSIVAETKVLVCPVTNEQKGNGAILEEYGCGILYPEKEFNIETLRTSIKQLIDNKEMRNNIIFYKNTFINSKSCNEIIKDMNKEFNIFNNSETNV